MIAFVALPVLVLVILATIPLALSGKFKENGQRNTLILEVANG